MVSIRHFGHSKMLSIPCYTEHKMHPVDNCKKETGCSAKDVHFGIQIILETYFRTTCLYAVPYYYRIINFFVNQNLVQSASHLIQLRLLAVRRKFRLLYQGHLMQTFILFKQKMSSRKHIHDEEAATNVGTFELINCKEV